MSVRLKLGPEEKDLVIFASKEDHSTPSTVTLPEPEPSPGLILPNGDINWNCPCLGGMATGPCGVQFREAFSCFHYSDADPKGSDCYESFSIMQECMAKYPTLYNKDSGDDDDPMKFEDIEDSDRESRGLTAASSSEIEKVDSKDKSPAPGKHEK